MAVGGAVWGGGVSASAQANISSIPANSPTSAGGYPASTPEPRTAHRATVTYTEDLVTVVANNSSLNQILRDIARATGMKITGGVSDDRVFGTYGPGAPAAILATLLDGSGSNILIVQGVSSAPRELVLTPRTGGVTPPNPNATSVDDSDNSEYTAPQATSTQPASPVARPADSRSPNRTGTGGVDVDPAATAPSSTMQQLAFPPIDASTPPATATTTPVGPDPTSDSVRTPQQIFEQLQKLRQQQPQQPTTQTQPQ